MPVKFEGHSEYERKFPWRQSFRSASFEPSSDQLAPPAGLASCQIGPAVLEPPLQKKKHVLAQSYSSEVQDSAFAAEPPLQSKKRVYSTADVPSPQKQHEDYFLLGGNSKFSSNIVYQSKSRDRLRSKSETRAQDSRDYEQMPREQMREKARDKPSAPSGRQSPPPAPRGRTHARRVDVPVPTQEPTPVMPDRNAVKKARPPPKVKVNPGGPNITVQKKDTVEPSKHAGKGAAQQPARPKPILTEAAVAEANARQQEADHMKKREERPHHHHHRHVHHHHHDDRNKNGDKHHHHHHHGHHHHTTADDRVKAPRKEKQAEAPGKPGGQPKKQLGSKRPGDPREQRRGKMDEAVQTNMDKGVVDSQQHAKSDYAMKYRAGIAPTRPKGPKRLSEYQLQFAWKDAKSSSPLIAAEQVVYNSNPHLAPYKSEGMPKKSEYHAAFQDWHKLPKDLPEPIPRSKSLEDLRPDQQDPAGAPPKVSEEDKRLLQTSLNPQKLHFPHGRIRRSRSEYLSNFQAPSKYEYKDGTWHGANPPHVQPRQENGSPPQAETAPLSASSWYNEVMELRQRAAEYKKRAQGTHFSHEHLAQLYAQQAELWDNVSTSSALSALSLESSTASERPQKRSKKQQKPVAPASTDGDITPRNEASEDGTLTPQRLSLATSSRASTISEATMTTDDGRVPTPKLGPSWGMPRHHLDRTTPSVGGALLVSPPRGARQAWTPSSVDEEEETTPKVAQSEPSAAQKSRPPKKKKVPTATLR